MRFVVTLRTVRLQQTAQARGWFQLRWRRSERLIQPLAVALLCSVLPHCSYIVRGVDLWAVWKAHRNGLRTVWEGGRDGRDRSVPGGKEKYVLGFVGKVRINHFEDLFVDVRIILKLILNK